jgi:hypothetical protein
MAGAGFESVELWTDLSERIVLPVFSPAGASAANFKKRLANDKISEALASGFK